MRVFVAQVLLNQSGSQISLIMTTPPNWQDSGHSLAGFWCGIEEIAMLGHSKTRVFESL